MTVLHRDYVMAFDPGETHCGVALLRPDPDAAAGWRCVAAYEKPPQDACDDLAVLLIENALEVVVYERFRLYPDLAPALAYSEMETSQQIGVIRYLVQLGDRPRELRPAPTLIRKVQLVGQVAEIQTPTRSLLRANGVQSRAKRCRAGEHALSAELHGWCYLIRHDRCGIKVMNPWPEGND